MEQILRQFSQANLYEGSSFLLKHLHILHTQEDPIPMLFADYWEGEVPKYVQTALGLTKTLFYIGEVCDESLAGGAGDGNLHEDIEKLRANAHYQSMMVFAVELKQGICVTRSEMAVLTRAFNRLVCNFPVTVIFRQEERLSIATCERTEYKQEWKQGQGEKLGKVHLLKDIDCLHPHRGHLDILESLNVADCSTFDALYAKWLKVFNSEVLTKKFYNDLFEWYQWAIDPATKVTFPSDVDIQSDDREDIDTKIIRLITRLMFVWFIKQKKLVPEKIFNVNYLQSVLKNFDPQSTTDCNYYQAILQNLFFGTLNRPVIDEDGSARDFAKASRADVKNLYRYEELFSIPESEVVEMFSTVPYLNCGLFECQDKTKLLDGVEKRYYHDGFSRNARKFDDGTYRYRAVVPNVLFFAPEKGLLSIFDRYVFTIEENTPQDVQVALDPELLGKVFENLLGAYNPETKETARNQSGSFYTPREIVQYMVNESLVAHLNRTVGKELESQYRELLDFTTEHVDLTKDQKKAIMHSLVTCKVLDPACGSGAFPMGMLQQMVHILQQVDPDNEQWRDVLLNMAVEESRKAFGLADEEERKKKLREIEETFNANLKSPDYTRKLYLIESCIYGVDIQPIAMLITRLRFFITLVCEQQDIQLNHPENNFGIKTLPNLESKFVAANSLIDADIHQYNEDWTNNEELSILKNELIGIRRRHFYTRKRSEKMRLLKEDKAKREQIHKLINVLVGEPNEDKIAQCQAVIAQQEALLPQYLEEDWVMTEVEEQTDLFGPVEKKIIRKDLNKAKREQIIELIRRNKEVIEKEYHKSTPTGFEAAVLQVTDWNPYDQNSVSPFLDIEWMFGMTDGFDIVIGNPPYIQLQAENGKLAVFYQDKNYKTFCNSGDIYSLFYEKGSTLLKQQGHLCFITSNKWMKNASGESTRDYLSQKTNPLLLINFAGLQLFDNATVETNILLISKGENKGDTTALNTETVGLDFELASLSEYTKNKSVKMEFKSSDEWIILSPFENSILNKAKKLGTKLSEQNVSIFRGITTGNNDAFIISSQTRETILSNCSESEFESTANLIGKAVRGRDLSRYSFQWNDCWIIQLYPALNLSIDDYPSIKHYLLTFCKDSLNNPAQEWILPSFVEEYCQKKLEQTGNDIIINGRPVLKINGQKDKSRKRTSNKWFEIQDSTSYYKELSKPKIIWGEISDHSKFAFDSTGEYLCEATTFFMTGDISVFLLCYLNSKFAEFLFSRIATTTGMGTIRWKKYKIEQLLVPKLNDIEEQRINQLYNEYLQNGDHTLLNQIDLIIFDHFELTQEERNFILQES